MTDSIFLSAKTVLMESLHFTNENVSGNQNLHVKTTTTSFSNSNLFQSKIKNKIS